MFLSSTLLLCLVIFFFFFFFFNDTATTEIYTLSLHDALPICCVPCSIPRTPTPGSSTPPSDRKSTRLNSSHVRISYAVFCLKKKKNIHCLTRHITKKTKYHVHITEVEMY